MILVLVGLNKSNIRCNISTVGEEAQRSDPALDMDLLPKAPVPKQ